MVMLTAGALAASGYVVLAEHPWKSGKLRAYAEALGKKYPPDALVIRIPPPWSKVREYLDAASEAQLRAMYEFGKLAHETAGQPLIDRLNKIRSELKDKSYPGKKPKVRLAGLSEVSRILKEMGVEGIEEFTVITE